MCFFNYSMPHYMVILHALLNLIISFTFALNNNKLYWMLFILVTSIIERERECVRARVCVCVCVCGEININHRPEMS